MTPQLDATLKVLQLVTGLMGLVIVLVGVGIPALFWKMSKEFATKKDMDGLGGRQTAFETLMIGTRDRADGAHERIGPLEERLDNHLQWIHSDLDALLDRRRRSAARRSSTGPPGGEAA